VIRGAFITVEGGEGVGKSSSISALAEAVRELGFEVVLTREPGGTALGESVRTWILDRTHEVLLPETEALLMFAARAQHLAEVIRPALQRGAWIVCDRFTDATVAYQGGGRGVSMALLTALRREVQKQLEPDLTLLLDAPASVGLERIQSRELDHFEREGAVFLEKVRRQYLDIARTEPGRVKVVDATRPLDAVTGDLVRLLNEFAASFSAEKAAAK